MRTSWMLSRRIVSATRDRRVEPGIPGCRATAAWLLAGLVLSLVLGLSGCDAGGGSDSAARSTTERSGTRPAPSGTESPSETTTEPTRPPRTTADTPSSIRLPTSAERPSSPTSAEALTPTSAPTTSAAGTPAAAESEGLGALGWTLLILLVVALAAGWLIWRSRRRSAWDAQAAALGIAVLGVVGTAVYRGQMAEGIPAGVPDQAAAAARDTLGGAVDAAGQLPKRLGAELLEVAREAFTQDLHLAAAVSAAAALAFAVLVVVLLRGARPSSIPDGAAGPKP
jgi:hypothetical protein